MSGAVLDDVASEVVADGPWAVETHGLTKRFGESVAVNSVDLRVPRGCAFVGMSSQFGPSVIT